MKTYQMMLLLSCGLGLFLLTVSSPFSGSYTVQWGGKPCAAGTEYGFPLPFMYSMNRQILNSPQTHSTSVCPTSADSATWNGRVGTCGRLCFLVSSFPSNNLCADRTTGPGKKQFPPEAEGNRSQLMNHRKNNLLK